MLIPLYRKDRVAAYAIVDAEDYDRLSVHIWHLEGRYAERRPKRTIYRVQSAMVRMHRAVMDPPHGMQVDHINGDKLDNRKSNLRVCTASQNKMNIGARKHNKLGLKGVSRPSNGSYGYVANICRDGKQVRVGRFQTKEEAHAAYVNAAIELHGEFARI